MHHTLPELAEVQALSQMNDHWPKYSAWALGKVCMCACMCACVCVCSIICGGYKRVGHNENGLVVIFRHTCTQTHKDFPPCTHAHDVTTPTT